MSFYSEYPHTRNYDDDLRELIARYNDLGKQYEDLIKIYDKINSEIETITLEQLQKWLDDGALESIINEGIFSDLNNRVTQNTANIAMVNKVALSIDNWPKQKGDLSDSERIQRAIDYLHTLNGGTLTFPQGTYEILTTLKIYDNIILKGVSNVSTVFNVNANIPFIQCFDIESRHDNMGLHDLYITRYGSDVNTPIIEWSHCAYSRLVNVNIYQMNGQQLNEGCVGIHLDAYSYYNMLQSVQIRQCHTGILAENAANGNVYIGGSCVSCGAYGVHIVGTNSNSFFGHAVELGGNNVTAYYLEKRSLFNTFFGCRIEAVGISYKAIFEDDNMSSFNNLVVGGLDYSTNGEDFTSVSNFIASATNLINIASWINKPAFKLGMNTRQTGVSANTPTKLSNMVTFYDRTNSCDASNSKFTAPTTGLYTFYVSIYTVTAQSNGVKLCLYVNGAELNTIGVTAGRVPQFGTSFSAYLQKGDYVEPYIILSTASDIYQGGGSSFFTGAIL